MGILQNLTDCESAFIDIQKAVELLAAVDSISIMKVADWLLHKRVYEQLQFFVMWNKRKIEACYPVDERKAAEVAKDVLTCIVELSIGRVTRNF